MNARTVRTRIDRDTRRWQRIAATVAAGCLVLFVMPILVSIVV